MKELKASELRIGNYVYSPLDKKDVQVDGYDIFMMENNHFREKEFEPIELTEEWLIKMGFQKTKLEYWDQNIYRKDMFILDESFRMMDIDITVNFKTVHHLQNAFFALTGEELTIKN